MSKDEVLDATANAMFSRRLEERARHRAVVGPHADRMEFFIDGRNARTFASQGQQRSIALAWKIAEVELVKKMLGVKPVLLLDDVMSELDMSRRDYLLNHLDGRQVFITCCDPETVRLMETGRGFYVEKGTVRQDTDEKAGEVHAENETPTCESE